METSMTASQLNRFILAIIGDFVDSFLLGKVPNTKHPEDPEVTNKPAIILLLLFQLQVTIRNDSKHKMGITQFSSYEITSKEEML